MRRTAAAVMDTRRRKVCGRDHDAPRGAAASLFACKPQPKSRVTRSPGTPAGDGRYWLADGDITVAPKDVAGVGQKPRLASYPHNEPARRRRISPFPGGPVALSVVSAALAATRETEMGLKTGDFPPVDPATFMEKPYLERNKTLAAHWAEYGFGAPKITAIIYVVKLLVFYTCGGILVATLTSGLDPFAPGEWWDQPIFYQKAVIWTMMLEALGFAGSWGPLAGHFKPMTGGCRYYARPGTLRMPPWPGKVPFTRGDERTFVDVAIYAGFILSLALALALPGDGESLVPTAAIVPAIVLLVLLGLRDKISFLQARSEQYLPALIFFAFFPFVDMIIAAKVLIVIVWLGASISKLGHHFSCVIPPMVSNTPWLSSKWVKRMHYRNFPDDLRPSPHAVRFAHVGGHDRGVLHAAGAAVLAQRDAHRGRRDPDGLLPPVHHLDVPARGAAGVERAVHVPARVPVPRLPRPGRVCGR